MATIGLASLIRGVATLVFGAGVRSIVLPVGDDPLFLGPIMLPPVQLVGAGVSLVFLAGFTWFFLKTRIGVAMRAVADNQTVSMGMGINVQRYFALAWALTGVVSALGGVIWGAMLGVDNQLPLVGLKVFPVVILGGLDSIVGAVVGGLIVGVVESTCRGLSGSGGWRRHQGFRALCADDPDADDPPLRPVRPPPNRARVMPRSGARLWPSRSCDMRKSKDVDGGAKPVVTTRARAAVSFGENRPDDRCGICSDMGLWR